MLWYLPVGIPGGPQHHAIVRLPVRPAVYERWSGQSRIQVNPFTLPTSFRYDARLARNRREAVRSLCGVLMVDLHPELRNAWAAVVRRGSRAEERSELGTVPLTESEALDFGRKVAADPRARLRIKLDWQEWARAKYRRLSSTAGSP